MKKIPQKKQKNEESNLFRNIFIISLILIVLIIFIFQISFKNKIVDVMEIDLYVNISDKGIGFDNDPGMLNFGRSVPGGSSKKSILLSQNEYESLRVVIRNFGSISGFVVVSENKFRLEKGEVKEVDFILKVPKNQALGVYEGYTKITLLK